jgi:hypothetical protein
MIERPVILKGLFAKDRESNNTPYTILGVVSDVFEQEDDPCGDWQKHGRYHCLRIQLKQVTIRYGGCLQHPPNRVASHGGPLLIQRMVSRPAVP